MREAHNRRMVQKMNMDFYIVSGIKRQYFKIPYAYDMDMVSCDVKTGGYELKQCRGSK
jgi:hypothetical protein